MKIFGIVSEFNPFHNGHEALVSASKAAGADYVVAVMSGNFVQRGEFSIADKHLRTRLALAGGVDMVIELPLAYSVATAGRFAPGAVSILSACGVVDTIAFGSESGDYTSLAKIADIVDSDITRINLKPFLSEGMTFAKARQLAAEKQVGRELSDLLATPNNALAVEYLRAAKFFDWNTQDGVVGVFTIQRLLVAHDAHAPSGNIASASYLRAHMDDKETRSRYMPPDCVEILSRAADGAFPFDKTKAETAILSHLRRLNIQDLSNLPDLSEGLEHRLYNAIRTAASLEELHQLVKTKRYTMARVRRLVISAFLGITARDQTTPPAYIRVLGYRKTAANLPGLIGREASLPVGTSLMRLSKLSDNAKRQAELEALAGDLYTLCLPEPRPCGEEYRVKVISL